MVERSGARQEVVPGPFPASVCEYTKEERLPKANFIAGVFARLLLDDMDLDSCIKIYCMSQHNSKVQIDLPMRIAVV